MKIRPARTRSPRANIAWSKSLTLGMLGVSLLAGPAQAQNISVDTLGQASAYDSGLRDQNSGGLDPSLWQGTSAEMAKAVIETAPVQSQNAVIQDLIKAALLSGGVPPLAKAQEASAAYDKARLIAIAKLGDKSVTSALIERAPNLVNDPVLKTEMALLTGDTNTACGVADARTEGRATPIWARLRAFCHAIREEGAAAELTTDLLLSSGYEDPTFFKLMPVILGTAKPSKATANLVYDEALYLAMADIAEVKTGKGPLSPNLAARRAIDLDRSDTERLDALFEGSNAMSDAQIKSVLTGFASSETEMSGGLDEDIIVTNPTVADPTSKLDLATAMKSDPAKGFGQIYALVLNAGSPEEKAKAVVEFLKRAEQRGQFDRFATLVDAQAQTLSANIQATIGLKTFTRLAVNRSDIGTLQGLYRSLEDEIPQKARLALVSDAVGNGFFAGGLGLDIEKRLMAPAPRGATGTSKARAQRDSYIALAMGATLSQEVATEIEQGGTGTGRAVNAGSLLALHAAARQGARAEVALRTASLLAPEAAKRTGRSAEAIGATSLDAASLASIIMALRTAGLDNYAGRLAAEDFLSGL